MVATNLVGTSVVSSPLQAVEPLARPGAPTLTGLTSGDSILTVAFTAGSPGGDPISSYQYSLDGGTTWQAATGTTSPLTIDGLTDGTSYNVALRALSAAGAGATSNVLTGTPYTYPAPVNAATIVPTVGNGQLLITWTVPSNGGSAITQAQVTAFSSLTGGSQEGNVCTTTTNLTVGATASCTVTGLTNGTTYYVSIQSDNAAGWSDRSTPRVAATPLAPPGAVSAVTGVSGDGRVALSWTAGSTGGSPVTNYTVWYSSGGAYTLFPTATSTATSATVTGLTNGTAYTFEVYAWNIRGTGPASAPSPSVTPEGPSITSAPLRAGEVGIPYSATPTESGGTGPFTWSVASGSLPTGLSLNASTGAVTGTPTVAGQPSFGLEVTDAVSGTATQSESPTIAADPAISSPDLPGGEVGVGYSAVPQVSAGTGPFMWSIATGSLPTGLILNAATGAVTGTPTMPGTTAFHLRVTDSLGVVATQSESITIASDPTVTAPLTGTGEVGVPYDSVPAAAGGSGPYTWSVDRRHPARRPRPRPDHR